MIFTRHAYERYRQFHMLDQPTATDDDARQILERFGPTAVLTRGKTHRGDPVWAIEALGVELVAKNESGVVTCVTVLPPPEFRGLTPLQAEAVAVSVAQARERADVALAKAVTEKARLVEVTAQRPRIKTVMADAHAVVSAASHAASEVCAERDILVAVLKTMRHQLNREEQRAMLDSVIRTAVRRMIAVGDEEGLAEIAAIEPGFVAAKFLAWGAK